MLGPLPPIRGRWRAKKHLIEADGLGKLIPVDGIVATGIVMDIVAYVLAAICVIETRAQDEFVPCLVHPLRWREPARRKAGQAQEAQYFGQNIAGLGAIDAAGGRQFVDKDGFGSNERARELCVIELAGIKRLWTLGHRPEVTISQSPFCDGLDAAHMMQSMYRIDSRNRFTLCDM